MSVEHYITCVLNDKYNKDILQEILLNFEKEGINFFVLNEEWLRKVSIDELVQIFLDENSTKRDNDLPSFFANYKDTSFTCSLEKKGLFIEIIIHCSSFNWIKEFSTNEVYIDFGRYLDLILKITEPFEVISIDTETLE